MKFEAYSQEELKLIDDFTPKYRTLMSSLSIQKRKILAAIARHGEPVRINELTELSRLDQQNKTSSQVHRLVKDSLLEKQEDGRYFFKDKDFFKYLDVRLN